MKLNLKSETAAGIVAGAAFIASAGHIVSVVDETNPILFALAYPIGIDGLIFVGIRSIQSRRPWAGALALLIGTIYSLAFNGHAEKAFEMHSMMIASSMPICMFAAFIIEATAKTAEEIAVLTPAPIAAPVPVPVVQAPPVSRWIGAGARYTLPIVPLSAPAPIKVRATVSRPAAKAVAGRTDVPAIEAAGRIAAWDVEKAVRLIADGRTNEEIASTVGTNAKAVQRTKRAIKIMQADASLADADVSEMMNRDVAPAHVGRIRAALLTKENA